MKLSNLTKPKCSLLFILVIILVFLVTNVIVLRCYCGYFYRIYFSRLLIPSPLKQVAVGHQDSESTTAAAYSKPYDFGRDAFTKNIPIWDKLLSPYEGMPINYLEVGVFEGRSLIWMLENILTDPGAKATAIDIFDSSYEHKYMANLELTGVSDKVTNIKGFSQLSLRELPFESFDIVYIDGSHFLKDVLEDAVLSWRLVKPGGLLIFDDYRQAREYEKDGRLIRDNPKFAVDGFAQCFDEQFEVIHNDYQLILRRVRADD